MIWNAPSLSFTPNDAETFVDTLTAANQVPGTTGDHEGVTNAQVFTTANGTGQDFNGTAGGRQTGGGGQPSWLHTYKAASTHYETWDGAC